MTGITKLSHLTTRDAELIDELAKTVENADKKSPINDATRLVIDGARTGIFFVAGPGIASVAVVDPKDRSIVAFTHPQQRRRGLGSSVLSAALSEFPDFHVWAFGSLPPALALARTLDLVKTRGLLTMGRALTDEPAPILPPGYELSSFHSDDAEAWVALNRLAFADHPEQGNVTLSDFQALTQQDWFRTEDLLLAKHGDRLVGFHWTKRHSPTVGEVYVVAVHPDHAGVGLGRALLTAGTTHLAQVGCTYVHLYVAENEPRLVRLYESANFGRLSLDTSYARKEMANGDSVATGSVPGS